MPTAGCQVADTVQAQHRQHPCFTPPGTPSWDVHHHYSKQDVAEYYYIISNHMLSVIICIISNYASCMPWVARELACRSAENATLRGSSLFLTGYDVPTDQWLTSWPFTYRVRPLFPQTPSTLSKVDTFTGHKLPFVTHSPFVQQHTHDR